MDPKTEKKTTLEDSPEAKRTMADLATEIDVADQDVRAKEAVVAQEFTKMHDAQTKANGVETKASKSAAKSYDEALAGKAEARAKVDELHAEAEALAATLR